MGREAQEGATAEKERSTLKTTEERDESCATAETNLGSGHLRKGCRGYRAEAMEKGRECEGRGA